MKPAVVCITTLNEADSIGGLVAQIRACGHHVIVSDGGSTDGTPDIAAAAGAHVLLSRTRLPIGPALIRAYHCAVERDYDRFIQMDAGGSHKVDCIGPMLDIDADVVIGSRFMRGSFYIGRAWRQLASRLMTNACWLFPFISNFSDWTSGFRVYSRRAVRELLEHEYSAAMHGWQIETLARLSMAGMVVKEYPIVYFAGRSSMNFNIAAEAWWAWWRLMNPFWRYQ